MSVITKLSIPAEHPAFAGHFPQRPILPGVVLLDEAIRAIHRTGIGGVSPAGAASGTWKIPFAKFLQPVRPGDTLTLEYELSANGSIRFTISSEAGIVATGALVP